jgi:polyphosphate kinase 2 (PPK2 family)
MNSKQVVVATIATNQTEKQKLKRVQDFERMLLTSDLDLALGDNYLDLDKEYKKRRKISKKSSC